MKTIHLGLLAALTLTIASCSDNPAVPFENPTQQNMSFKSGARYETQVVTRNPENGSSDTTLRRWTMVNPNTTLRARANVAVWVDSVFSLGGIFSVSDSILLQQLPGNNDVYRYGSLLPELRVPALLALDLGESWMHEAKLNATSSSWFVAEVADTIPDPYDIPAVDGLKIGVSDNAQAAGKEDVVIGSQTFSTTKTVHTIAISISVITPLATIPVKTESITRITWMSPELGAIVREEREGKVITIDYGGSVFTIPLPSYSSKVTAIISTGG